jgi:hypothetical protein
MYIEKASVLLALRSTLPPCRTIHTKFRKSPLANLHIKKNLTLTNTQLCNSYAPFSFKEENMPIKFP